MVTARQTPALLAPRPGSLAAFPAVTLGTVEPLVRVHRRSNEPWWFSCDGGGRFDLSAPGGTCYLARDVETAAREVLGPILIRDGIVPSAMADERNVTVLTLASAVEIAATTNRRSALFGLTRELSTVTPYDVPQAWAAELALSFDGISYASRFTTSAKANAVALFGRAGMNPFGSVTETRPLRDLLRSLGIAVVPAPTAAALIDPISDPDGR